MSTRDSDRAPVTDLLAGSRIIAGISVCWSWLQHVVSGSALYRWLTAEPDPDVMIIDLRDTYTVSPFLAILDTLISVLYPYFQDSRCKQESERLTVLAARLGTTRWGRTFKSLLEPPAQQQTTDRQPDSDSDDR